jgi:hypothetical protein
MMTPQKIDFIQSVNPDEPDDFLIVSSSWEERCLGFAQKTKFYKSKNILINVYDNRTEQKEKILIELTQLLTPRGTIKNFTSKQSRPIDGIRHMLNFIKNNSTKEVPRISFDISCFTRKHLLQLLNGLECNNLLGNVNFYYSQPTEYFDENNNTNAEGIKSICEVETFSGENLSSRDTALLLFLNFEGKRAISLWNEIQPHVTVPIVPSPSVKEEWDKRVMSQNKLLLSTLNLDLDAIERVSPLDTDSTKELLLRLTKATSGRSKILKQKDYNYIIAPLGTKPQVLGIFKYWRLFPNNFSIVYPSPIQYKNTPTSYPTEHVWLIDKSNNWEKTNYSKNEVST